MAEWFPFLFELQNFPFPFPPPPLKINVTSSGTAGKRPWRGKMDGYVEGKRDVKKKLHSMRRRRDVLHRCCSRHLLPHFFSGNVVSQSHMKGHSRGRPTLERDICPLHPPLSSRSLRRHNSAFRRSGVHGLHVNYVIRGSAEQARGAVRREGVEVMEPNPCHELSTSLLYMLND